MSLSRQNLVSVIIPTYGRPKLLKRSIESVFEQSYKYYEIIVIDDNNPESVERFETEVIMKNYLDRDNVIYIKHDKNRNGAAARNTGVANCNGIYICFLDDDDWFLPNKLMIQTNFLDKNLDFQAVYCGWIKNGIKYLPKYSGSLVKELLMMDYQPMTPTLMFRRDAILDLNGFDEEFKRHQDYELMLRFFKRFRVSFVNECLVQIGWNDGENNLHGEKLENLKNFFLMQFKDDIDILDSNYPGIRKKIFSRHYSRVFLSHLSHGYFKLAFRLLLRYVIFSPFNFVLEINRSLLISVKNKLLACINYKRRQQFGEK